MPTKRWGNHDYEVMTDFAGEKHLLADDGVDTKVAQIDAIIADIIQRLGYQVSEDSILSAALERLGYSNEWTSEQLWDAVFRGRTGVECMSLDQMYDEGRLFQDANGTTPVTGVEQPVGLMLDGSQRLRLGPELVTNGDFSDGDTGWILTDVINGAATIHCTGVARTFFKQEVNSNNTPFDSFFWLQYEVTENTLMPGADAPGMLIHENSDFKLLSGASLPFTVGTHRVIVRRVADTAACLWVYMSGLQTSGSITVDNVSLREVYGNHVHQPTDINRPVLSARVNGLKNTEDLSAFGWGSSYGATVTGTNVVDLPETNARLIQNWITPAPVGVTAKASVVLSGTGSLTLRLARRWEESAEVEYSDRKIDLTSTPQRYEVEHTIQYENQTGFQFTLKRDYGDTATQVTATKADLRYSNDGVDLPEYQRVGDVDTAPGDYDSLNFPMYLAFNGTNQSLKVSGMQPEVDEVFISAALRINSDERQMIFAFEDAEGSFYIDTGDGAGNSIRFLSKGTIPSFNNRVISYAPISNVVSTIGKISDDRNTVIVGKEYEQTSNADQGVGNYSNSVLNIGSRNGTTLFHNGRLYGFLLVFDNPTDTIITTIERELNRKAKIHA